MEFLNDKPNEVDCRPHPFMTAPGSATSITTKPALSLAVAGPSSDRAAASMRRPVGSLWGEMESQNPACFDPANAAAHLHLLGEALGLIGHLLKGTKKSVCVSTSLFLLLDSLLCGLAPLMCLTSHIPELHQCTDNVLDSTLENIAYIMPGF
ncbi:HMG box-containing protein 4-like [Syngnathus acus]|uniref:HMG box-containing protein 4-like n=1 Tax=Syngnathus acus TaxID=161584 RepID=UPI001885ABCD|nr:HMG box-containing protein 4-like [Syngnathus acus]